MKVGIFANPTKADAPKALKSILKEFDKYGIEAVLDVDAASILGEKGTEDFYKGVDLVLSLGGDGTMLETVHRIGSHLGIGSHLDMTIAGINIGTLGFLTTCTDECIPEFAKHLHAGTLKTMGLSMLEVEMCEEGKGEQSFWALNEVVLMRGNTGRLVSIDAEINGEFITHYKADGLIVATPAGSTAYSLAAGGPLIAPESGVFVINPICPHSLSNRSLVVSNTSVITLKSCKDESEPILFTTDGRDVLKMAPNSQVKVKRAKFPLMLLQMPDSSYYKKLRAKLDWDGGVKGK